MPVREILLLGNPQLWQPSSAITDVRAEETREIISDLAATLYDFRERQGFGRAIAAPQIGAQRRILFVKMTDESFGPAPLINPEIVRASSETMELWDDCFSFPDLMVRVRRHVEIDVRYLDEAGQQQIVTARGDLSELLQHEIDHLDGILATDRALNKRSFALRSEIKPS
ncbi:MAG TPA: peptide deformylase [Blastocatellia bacterium]|nr:peptide deformylase [Blastocatellia bacterium]HMV85252.1 peptide deformylase [Blastocatellia bacterium]HMX25796.1 peptide deformylase [Blastocatellia bacterium]HMZ17891.1 peptide deformylase [Blastocatellia bacterium]HNG33297.1 peptide deformylase [Blastocatellia bacterium]